MSKIGGIGATINIIAAAIGPPMVLKFMVAFANIILRKARQKIAIFRIKDIKKGLKKIREIIDKKIEDNEHFPEIVEQCKKELAIISKDSKEFK